MFKFLRSHFSAKEYWSQQPPIVGSKEFIRRHRTVAVGEIAPNLKKGLPLLGVAALVTLADHFIFNDEFVPLTIAIDAVTVPTGLFFTLQGNKWNNVRRDADAQLRKP